MSNVDLFIAHRIYSFRNADGKRNVPPAVRIAMVGIALGLAVMILSVAIIMGFKKEVREKVIGFGSHVQITNFDNNASYEPSPVTVSDSLLEIVKSIPHVTHVERFATKPGILKTETDFQGIALKGVDENYDWSFFRSNMKDGEVFAVSKDSITNSVIISQYIANLLRLNTGDSFLAYFVNQENVRARRFVISGVYDTGFSDYDRLFVISDIKHIRRLNGWAADEVGGIEVKADAFESVDAVADSIYYAIGNISDAKGNMYYVRSIKDMNPMIFSWLDVLDVNVAVILVLMLVVAGFTMIAGLLIIILERVQMIGVLKALGATNGLIRRVFLYLACFLVGKGMLWGNVIGIVLCLLQWRFRFVGLDSSVYYLDAVPIDLNIGSLLLLNIGAMAASMLMLLAPSHIITTIRPSKSIRFE